MKTRRFLAWVLAIALLASLTVILTCSGDDDDDDDEVSWADRCEDFVETLTDTCGFTLFDLSEEDAIASCTAMGDEIPWECVVECWENTENCQLWFQCVTDVCDVGAGDDDDSGDDDTGDDDTGDDDSDDKPAILSTSNEGCKNGAGLDEEEDWPQDIVFDYSGGVLTVTHVSGVFNCCIDAINVTMELSGLVIDLYEVEYAPNPCFCVCPYDVVTRIANLEAGTYTVNIYANGHFAIAGEVEIP